MSKASEWLRARNEVDDKLIWWADTEKAYYRARIIGTPENPYVRLRDTKMDNEIDLDLASLKSLAQWALDVLAEPSNVGRAGRPDAPPDPHGASLS